MQAARQRQETLEFKAQYALRAGVESTLSQGVRRFDLRRIVDWLKGRTYGEQRREEGHFALFMPCYCSKSTLSYAGMH